MVTTVSIFILISFVRLLYCSQSPSNTHKPSYLPTSTPSSVPSSRPTASPSVSFDPTPCPSSQPTGLPTGQPSAAPSRRPTSQPTRQPTSQPTSRPSHPTKQPTPKPSYKPSTKPSCIPTTKPTAKPTYTKTNAPSSKPTTYHAPTPLPSELPTGQPSARPSSQPTAHPSPHPTKPTYLPTKHPLSYQPSSKPTPRPSSSPDNNLPTFIPTSKPSVIPTSKPSSKPTVSPSAKPTKTPISSPTSNPIISSYPTGQPTGVPTFFPSGQPTTRPTVGPTKSKPPTSNPTSIPSRQPTSQPTGIPSNQPTSQPTSKPSIPTGQPTTQPSRQPTRQPTSQPTSQPTTKPTSGYHTPKPSTLNPTALPTFTVPPTSQPTGQPSKEPTGQPSSRPTSYPSVSFPPTYLPSSSPTGQPTSIPTTIWGSTSAPTYAYLLYNVTGSVSFDSTNTCEDLEITLQFTFHRNISSGTIILIETPGLTSGSCYNPIDGSHISDVVVFNSSLFTLSYYEGSYSTLYNTSYLKINITHPVLLSIGYKYSLIIDRINGLKRACTTNTTWIVKYYRSNRLTPVSVGHLRLYESASLRCYFFNTSLSFSPAFPQFPTGINITLFPAFLLDSSMSFDIYLPGFSNQIENYPLDNLGYNYTTVEEVVRYISSNSTLLELSYNTNYSWFGTFHGFNSSGYNSSFIRISPRGSQEYITSLWIYIPAYPNRLIPLCGHPANYSGYTIKTDSPIGNIYVNDTVISYSSASGPGCSKLNNCNGNGNCNFCDMKCECYSGFGSLSDLSIAISNDFNPDCSSRLCPIGPAFAAIPSYSTDTRLASVHRSTECSNNGICDRSIGKCKCFKGFVGNSCEKRNCPSIDGKLCSGRGQCLSMRLLAYESTALPLQRNSSSIFYTGIISPNAWDKDSSYQCLCDSSWKVGLGSNQTQLAEFFGPACELRRCPSGNDPETDEDETDCANKSQTGGDVGQEGNKCQIDCSNRGVCDYNTGTCTCFTGYQGINCGTIQRYAGHIYRDEIIYSNRQPTSLGEGTLASYLTDSIDPSETLSEYESS